MRYGSYLSLGRDDPYVLAYLRKNPGSGDSVLVVLNMSGEPRTVKLDLAALGIKATSAKMLMAAPDPEQTPMPLDHFTMAPFGAFVGSVR